LSGKIYTPKDTFNPDGFTWYRPNETFVREGHPILDQYGHMFKEVQPQYEWPEVEQATAGPGERRGEKVKAHG